MDFWEGPGLILTEKRVYLHEQINSLDFKNRDISEVGNTLDIINIALQADYQLSDMERDYFLNIEIQNEEFSTAKIGMLLKMFLEINGELLSMTIENIKNSNINMLGVTILFATNLVDHQVTGSELFLLENWHNMHEEKITPRLQILMELTLDLLNLEQAKNKTQLDNTNEELAEYLK